MNTIFHNQVRKGKDYKDNKEQRKREIRKNEQMRVNDGTQTASETCRGKSKQM